MCIRDRRMWLTEIEVRLPQKQFDLVFNQSNELVAGDYSGRRCTQVCWQRVVGCFYWLNKSSMLKQIKKILRLLSVYVFFIYDYTHPYPTFQQCCKSRDNDLDLENLETHFSKVLVSFLKFLLKSWSWSRSWDPGILILISFSTMKILILVSFSSNMPSKFFEITSPR